MKIVPFPGACFYRAPGGAAGCSPTWARDEWGEANAYAANSAANCAARLHSFNVYCGTTRSQVQHVTDNSKCNPVSACCACCMARLMHASCVPVPKSHPSTIMTRKNCISFLHVRVYHRHRPDQAICNDPNCQSTTSGTLPMLKCTATEENHETDFGASPIMVP